MQSLSSIRLRTNAMPKYMHNHLRFSFDNSATYKGHNSDRFNSLNNGLKSAESSLDKLQKEKRNSQSSLLDYLKNVCYNLKCDLAGYHNESLSQRDKEMFGIYQIESNQCENPTKLISLQKKIEIKKNSTNCFYNECYENFKNEPNPQNATRLQVIEESLKHIFMGLQNQDAEIIYKHENSNKNQKYTDVELFEFEQNHQYIFSIIDDFKAALQQKNKNPLQVIINSGKQNISDENKLNTRYKTMHNHLKTLSEKWV